MAEVHPCWGRPLDQYVVACGSDFAKQRAALDPDIVIEAHKAIRKICKLGGNADQTNQHNEANRIILPTLESVLELTLSTSTPRDLACPPLITGCFKLMAMVKQSGRPSVSRQNL